MAAKFKAIVPKKFNAAALTGVLGAEISAPNLSLIHI